MPDGDDLGPVVDVLHLPAHDVLVLDHDGREVLVPFVTAGGAIEFDMPALVVTASKAEQYAASI